MAAPVYAVEADWNQNGAFSSASTVYTDDGSVARFLGLVGTTVVTPDTGENVTARILLDAGVIAQRGRNQIQALSPPIANDLAATLNNRSGDYTAGNTGSPIYPNVDVGRLVRWSALEGVTTHEVIRGYLTQILPHPEPDQQSVGLVALSQLARLVQKTGYSSPLYGDGTTGNAIRTDQALGYVLDAAGLTDPALRAFDAGQTRLLFFVIRPTDDLFDLALRIWASEGPGARLYDAADGKTTFKSRYAGITDARSTSPQATYRDQDNGTDPFYLAPWAYDAGEQSVVNRCSVTHQRRTVDAVDAAFWVFGATVTLAAGEVRPFQVQPVADDPIASVVAPAAGTDYAVTVGSLASATFDRTSGPFVTLTLTGGPGGATLTGLQVRGKLARVTATTQVSNTIDTSASRARYGPKPYQLGTLPEIDYNVAQDFCNAVVGQYQTPRPTAVIEVPLVSSRQNTATLPREVADRVRVVNTAAHVDTPMFVESVRHVVPPGGVPSVFLGCEAAVDVDYAFWDVGLWDVALWAY